MKKKAKTTSTTSKPSYDVNEAAVHLMLSTLGEEKLLDWIIDSIKERIESYVQEISLNKEEAKYLAEEMKLKESYYKLDNDATGHKSFVRGQIKEIKDSQKWLTKKSKEDKERLDQLKAALIVLLSAHKLLKPMKKWL